MNSNVFAICVHDGKLFAGGEFTTAGGAPANRIAQWNGTTWQPLGDGMNGGVYAMTVYKGNLIAAGSFAIAGGTPANSIAQWNGTAWQSLGSGMGASSYVEALTTFGGNLFAGGEFTIAGATPADYIARWNGTSWQALGSGMGGRTLSYDPIVFALTGYRGNLVVGGLFTTAGGSVSAYWAHWGPSCVAADLNCDGVVSSADVPPFIDGLLNPASLTECTRIVADVNFDGLPNGDDIQSFVRSLLGS